MEQSEPIHVGEKCPPLKFGDYRVFPLHRLRDETTIFGIFSSFDIEPLKSDHIRAELRGLGATLLLLIDSGLWRLNADSDIECLVDAEALTASTCTRIQRNWGIVPDTRHPGHFALFVIDGQLRLRFVRYGRSPAPPDCGPLIAALSAACQAVRGDAKWRFSRREMLVSGLVAGFAVAYEGCTPTKKESTPRDAGAPTRSPEKMQIAPIINGERRSLQLEARVSLLDALREDLGLTGTKKGCDHGQCGACTVLVDGRAVLSCLTLAVTAHNKQVTTIEGLARGNELHPIQSAFIEEDAFQCGYCTPGQIMNAAGLLQAKHPRSEMEVRELMSGNLCRCGAYPNIVRAVMKSQGQLT